MPTAAPGEVSSLAGNHGLPLHGRTSLRGRAPVHLGKAEVQNLQLPALGEKEICWLDVSVHDALGMGRFKGVSDLNSQRQQLLYFHRLPAHPLRQRAPF